MMRRGGCGWGRPAVGWVELWSASRRCLKLGMKRALAGHRSTGRWAKRMVSGG